MPPTKALRFETMRRPLPEGEALAARFDMVRARAQDRPQDSFALLVPKSFVAVPALERRADRAPGDWIDIGLFASAAGDSITASLAPIGRDVSLADLCAWEAERAGLEPISVDPLDFGGREAVDATAKLPLTEAEFLDPKAHPPRITRFLVFRRGDALVRLSTIAARDRWATHTADFAWACSSLRFDQEVDAPFLEPYVWCASGGAIPLGFRRPASWRLEERKDPPWGRQVLDLARLDAGAQTDFIRAIAVDRDTHGELTLAALAAETLDGLRTDGHAPGALRRRATPVSPGGAFKPATVATIHEGRAFGGPCEIRILCLETTRAVYCLAGVFPARDPDRLAWMCGKRTLEIAYQTLLRPEEGILTPEGTRKAALAAAAAEGAPDPVSPMKREAAPDAGAGDGDTADEDGDGDGYGEEE